MEKILATMNETKIDKGLNWFEKALQIVEKYKFKTVLKAIFYILLIAATVGFISHPTWIFEQYEEWKDKQHTEALNIRNNNNQKLQILSEKLLYKIGADRVMVLELHNGLTGNGGLPFSKCSATYEAIDNNIIPIANQYQDVNLSLMPFSYELFRQGYWCGDVETLTQYDRSLFYKMKSNGCEHFAACVIEGIDKPLAFLFVSFTNDVDEMHNCQEVRENIRHIAMEMAVLMEINTYFN